MSPRGTLHTCPGCRRNAPSWPGRQGRRGRRSPLRPGCANGLDRLLGEQSPGTPVTSRADDDTAVILYTSGTTG
jgi:hypothetical protein